MFSILIRGHDCDEQIWKRKASNNYQHIIIILIASNSVPHLKYIWSATKSDLMSWFEVSDTIAYHQCPLIYNAIVLKLWIHLSFVVLVHTKIVLLTLSQFRSTCTHKKISSKSSISLKCDAQIVKEVDVQ